MGWVTKLVIERKICWGGEEVRSLRRAPSPGAEMARRFASQARESLAT